MTDDREKTAFDDARISTFSPQMGITAYFEPVFCAASLVSLNRAGRVLG